MVELAYVKLMKMFGSRCPHFGWGMLLAAWVVVPSSAQEPIVEYQFNVPGTNLASTGQVTDESASLNSRNPGNTAQQYNGEPGAGLTGDRDDFALDFSDATGMGINFEGGWARVGSNDVLPELDELQSYTVQGWFKTAEGQPIGNTVELMQSHGKEGGWKLTAVDPGKLRLFVDGENVIASDPAWNTGGEWVFFAATYDGSQKKDNVRFYVGSKEEEVRLVSTHDLARGKVDRDRSRLMVNRPDRPLKGLYDNVRVYGSKDDASGALDVEAIEKIRAQDVSGESLKKKDA